MKDKIKKIIGTQDEWESHIENIFNVLDRNLPDFRPDNMLDVGTGTGERSLRIAGHLGIEASNTFGVDFNEKKVAEAQKIINAQRIDLENDKLPFEDGLFELVTCNQVLEHLKYYREVIDEIIRVTKKGGYIVLGVPNLAHLINRIYLLIGLQPMCIHLNGDHVRSFSHRAFTEQLKSIKEVKLIGYAGSSIIYPLPHVIARPISGIFPGLSAYVCYLLQKNR